MSTTLPPIYLLHWTRFFNAIMFEGNDHGIEPECAIPEGVQINATGAPAWCTITTDHARADIADAVIFHAADYTYDGPTKRLEQPWVLYTLESPLTAPFRTDPEMMERFDYLASYHRKSAYFFTYFSPIVMDVANRPLPIDFMKKKSKSAPILWIAKNCHASSGRQLYVEQLMKYIQVDSYGSCLNNKDFPEGKTREQLMSEYKFYLAIENANCDDYVTEKLVDTLKFSAVPIVDGPASYDGYLPNQRAAIRMDAYPDPRELADYIRFLDENDDAYLAYLEHRRTALTKAPLERLDASFVKLWSDQTAHDYRVSWCSICRHMASTWTLRNSNSSTTTLSESAALGAVAAALEAKNDEKDLLLIDNSCSEPGKWSYAQDGPPFTGFTFTPTPKDEFARAVLRDESSSLSTTPDLLADDAYNESDQHSRFLPLVSISFALAVFAYIAVILYQRSAKSKNKRTPLPA